MSGGIAARWSYQTYDANAMLSRIQVKPALLHKKDVESVKRELVAVMREARAGRFKITVKDQDVHMAVERRLTRALGDLGKKIHTARSRNDQVATDFRLFLRDTLDAFEADLAACTE